MIRQALLLNIEQQLAQSDFFEANDFSVEVVEANEKSLIQVECRFSNTYQFTATVPGKQSTVRGSAMGLVVVGHSKSEWVFECSKTPGEVHAVESSSCSGVDDLLRDIIAWRNRVQTDLEAGPAYRRLTEQKREIEEITQQMGVMDEGYFSREEADDFKRKLDALETRLAQNIKTTIKKQEDQQNKIKRLHNEVNSLKAKLETFNKKGWASAFASRCWEWVKDDTNRKVLTSGAQVVKELMAPSHDIPKIGPGS